MTIGMILFWPALFFLEGGDGPEAAEYSRLKGEREALEKVAVQKRCSLPPAPQPATVSAPPQTSVTDGTLQMPASQQ